MSSLISSLIGYVCYVYVHVYMYVCIYLCGVLHKVYLFAWWVRGRWNRVHIHIFADACVHDAYLKH